MSNDAEITDEQRDAFLNAVGDNAIDNFGMIAIKDGFPPGEYNAINPGAYQEAIMSGDIAMEDTLFMKAQTVLENQHGPAVAPNYTAQFGVSANLDEGLNPSASFNIDMGMNR